MVRGASEIPARGHGDSGAVVARKQQEDVREDTEELAVETVCRGVTLHGLQPSQAEHALVVGDLGIVPAVEATSSEPLMGRAGRSSSIHANRITSPHRS